MSSSCSFRITRTAEDLAQTITALSQRLVKLEQRQEALELLLREDRKEEQSADEIEMLDSADQLLRECQELLGTSSETNIDENLWKENEVLEPDQENILAA